MATKPRKRWLVCGSCRWEYQGEVTSTATPQCPLCGFAPYYSIQCGFLRSNRTTQQEWVRQTLRHMEGDLLWRIQQKPFSRRQLADTLKRLGFRLVDQAACILEREEIEQFATRLETGDGFPWGHKVQKSALENKETDSDE